MRPIASQKHLWESPLLREAVLEVLVRLRSKWLN